MVSKDAGKGIEHAQVVDMHDPAAVLAHIARMQSHLGTLVDPAAPLDMIGVRMEERDHGKPTKAMAAPRGAKNGHWEPVQVADDPTAQYQHEQVWVEHHGMKDGGWRNGQLMKWSEETE